MFADPLSIAVVYPGFVVVSAVLIRIDILEHRLPHRIVLPFTAALCGVLAVHGMVWSSPGTAGRAALGGILLGAFYLVLRLISRAGIGGGDLVLSVPVGVFLAWHGWAVFAVGALGAFVLGALAALAGIGMGRLSVRDAIPFGPWMLLSAWLALLVV